jgi:hypothetical protein
MLDERVDIDFLDPHNIISTASEQYNMPLI